MSPHYWHLRRQIDINFAKCYFLISMNEKPYLHELDLFRFFAALSVVFFHFCFRGFAADNMTVLTFHEWSGWARYGYLGVNLFFMISGFVIFMSAEKQNAFSFFKLRALRLYPAFWLCCTLTFAVIYFFGAPHFSVPLQDYFINMTMLADYFDIASVDGAYWSLYVEMNFYLLIFLILLFKQASRMENLLIVWLVLSAAYYFWPVAVTITTLMRFIYAAPYFVAGGVFYKIYSEGLNIKRGLAILASFAMALLYGVREARGVAYYYRVEMMEEVIWVALAIFFILFALLAFGKLKILRQKRFVYLGIMTYPLYLIHQRIGFIIFNHFHQDLNKFVLLFSVLVLLLVMSYLIAAYFERPVIRWGRSRLVKSASPS